MKYGQQTIFITLIFLMGLVGCQNAEDSDDKEEQKQTKEESSSAPASQEADVDGKLWGSEGKTGVILSHGAAYDAESWKAQGEELAENGMVVFAVEDTSPEQLIAAANMLEDDYDVEKVSLVGASAGGATAIDAADDDAFDFNRTVLLSPGGDATDIDDIPVLVIYSEDEGFEELEEDVQEQSESSIDTLAIRGSAHAQAMFDDEKKGNQVMEKIIDFLNS